MSYEGFRELAGQMVLAVYKGTDKYEEEYLRFDLLDDPSIEYHADGDCCSRSWFEHVSGLNALLGRRVNEVIERKMPEAITVRKEYDDDDHTQYYGWSIVTDAGTCDIEMRNESNGYYGGSVDLVHWPLENVTWKPLEDF